MNDKIFELQQELITLQDSFKDAIMSEPDVEKHSNIIEKFSKKEADIATEIEKELEKEVKRIEKEAQDLFKDNVEQQEDSENINDNHPLVNTFKKLVKESATVDVIKDAKYFTNKYTSAKIKAVAESIGVKTTGTEIQIAEFILAKISAKEFEKLLS